MKSTGTPYTQYQKVRITKKNARKLRTVFNNPRYSNSKMVIKKTKNTSSSYSSSKSGSLNVQVPTVGPVSNSSFIDTNIADKKHKDKFKAAQMNTYTRVNPVKMAVGAAVQADQSYLTLQYSDIVQFTGSANQGVTANGNLVNTSKFLIDSVQAEYAMTNSSNGNVTVDIYSFKAKRDGTQSVNSIWYSNLRDASAQTIVDYTQLWGVSPFTAPGIFDFWNLQKIYHVNLGPGQSHVHRELYNVGKEFDNQIMELSGSTIFKDMTHNVFFLVRGMPQTANTGSNVTTQVANLDVILSETFKWKYIADNDTNFGFNIVSALGAATNIYNQGSGAAVVNAAI